VKTSEIYRIMMFQYNSECTNQRKVYRWIERFKERWMNIYDACIGGNYVEFKYWITEHIWTNLGLSSLRSHLK
jgi:hypothetical protein